METGTASNDVVLTTFRRHLRALEREVIRELATQTECCGVTLAQCHVLLEIGDSTLSLTGLSGVLGLDRSTLSRTVDSLVKAGLVERSEEPKDRRALRLVLTRAGSEKVAYIDDACNRNYAELLADISEEDRRHVLRGVTVMAERMRDCRSGKPDASCSAYAGREDAG